MSMKNSSSLSALAFLVFSALLAVGIQAEVSETRQAKPDFSEARRFINEHMREKSIPSISVAVARRGEILWEEGFGLADREKGIKASPDTMYYMASVNKSFAATALMIFQERKQLDLDRPVNDYLGAAKLTSPAWNPAGATIRRVANHTAGLTTFNPKNLLAMDEKIRRYGVLFWPPGEQFDYSNLGFMILDDVLARVSGKSFPEVLHDEIFAPLGMTHATVGASASLKDFTAQRYNSVTGVQPPVTEGVYCSAHDLVKFGMFCVKAHLSDQKRILSDAAIDAMYSSPVSTGSGKYSLSWSIDDDLHGYYGVLAQGGTEADQAWLRLIPSEGIAIVALANTGSMSSQVVQEILSALLPAYSEARATAQGVTPKSGDADKPVSNQPATALIGSWKGIIKTYHQNIPLLFSIRASGEVEVKLDEHPASRLNQTKFATRHLSGVTSGNLGVEEDTGPEPYQLEFYLNLRDGVLNGAVVTMPNPQLPFWTELKRQD